MVIMLGVLGYLYINKNKDTDGKKFAEEYGSVTEDNVFVYRSIDEIINILEHGTGVVYLGFPECPWCTAYVSYLDEVAKDNDVEKVVKDYVAEKECKNGLALWPLRTAVSGKQMTPGGAYEIMDILGKEESLKRIRKGIELLNGVQ